MTDNAAQAAPTAPVETVLRAELARGDAIAGSVLPILRHLLANDEHSVFSDEIVAAMRGMLDHLAAQLLDAISEVAGTPDARDHPPERITALTGGFVSHIGLLSHLHALALEAQLANRLQNRLAVDPVLSPLLQELTASADPQIAGGAMALMAAQARFLQSQRRMQLPLLELPGDLLHGVLLTLRATAGDDPAVIEYVAAVERSLRSAFDESRTRLSLISRIIMGMGGGAVAALSVPHAGVAIFLSALSIAASQDRDMVVLATNETQVARLALALRASGLRVDGIAEQFMAIHPDVSLPDDFERLGSDHAAALLAGAARYGGG